MRTANLTRQQVINLRAKMQKALDELGLDIELKVGNARYTDTECTFKVHASTYLNDQAKRDDVRSRATRLGCSTTGNDLNPGWTLVEYKSRNKAYKWIALDPAGRRIKMDQRAMMNRFKQGQANG